MSVYSLDYRAMGRDLFERGYRVRDARDLKTEFDLTTEEAEAVYRVLLTYEGIESHWEDIEFWMDDKIRQEVYDKWGEDSDKIILFDEYRRRDPRIWEYAEALI